MFRTYRFKHPQSDYVESIDGWSYIWAGVFGPFYILFKGFVGRFFLALVISCALGALGLFILSSSPGAWLFYGAVGLGNMIVQSAIFGELLRVGYLRRGWQELSRGQ